MLSDSNEHELVISTLKFFNYFNFYIMLNLIPYSLLDAFYFLVECVAAKFDLDVPRLLEPC